MSAHLLSGDRLLRFPSARIVRSDVAAVREADALLAEARATRESAREAARAAKARGYEEGRDQALVEMREALGEALAELTKRFAAENARREAGVAHAAMAVTEQLIGKADDADIVTGLARRALEQAGGATGATVQVAPEWAEKLSAALDNKTCEVRADPALDRFACRVTAGEGRIIADLDKQLANLRSRWGLDGGDGE